MAKKQLFLSHAWGKDTQSRDNHDRVRKVSKALNIHGWSTWLDENEMYNNIDYSMMKGINNADAVIICLTNSYFNKINSAVANPRLRDSCLKEFTYASVSDKIMIPIIMEKELLNPKKWPSSIISLYFGYTLFLNFTDENYLSNATKLSFLLKKYGLKPFLCNGKILMPKNPRIKSIATAVKFILKPKLYKTMSKKFKSTGNLLKIAI